MRHSLNNKDERGAILFGVLIIVLMVSLIGASLVALLSSLALSNQFEANQTKAFYLAEAGMSRAIYMLKSQAVILLREDYFVPPTELGGGTYEARLDFPQSLIICIGKVGGMERKIQLKYSSF